MEPWRMVGVVALALVAFAGNSVLTRWGLLDGTTAPGWFAVVRLTSGAVCLWALLAFKGADLRPRPQVGGTLTLLVYALGFSYAYVTLDTGAGALILFGVVQITLFTWALARAEPVPRTHFIGAVLSFAGLGVLFWPDPAAPMSLVGFVLMACAGVAWGLYTGIGRGGGDATRMTANNFLGAALCAAPFLVFTAPVVSTQGVIMAIVSGAVTSGLGYAAWYAALPHLRSSMAAILQLTVPIIAALGGIVFLGETLTVPFIAAAVLVIGGTALAVRS